MFALGHFVFIKFNVMKKISVLFAFALFGFVSCNIGEDGLDGDAYLSLNWSDIEPSYVDAGGVVPYDFVWDTYYRTRPGIYTIHFEYKYRHSYSDVIVPYDVDIEVWIVEGEPGRTNNRNGKDARDDVFFDVTLYPDGEIDFFDKKVRKSDLEVYKRDLPETKSLVLEKSEVQGKYGIKYSVYQLPGYEVEK